MEQLLVAALLPAINAVVRSTPAKHVRQNGETQKPITNNLIEQETTLSPPETSFTELESLNLDKRSPETLHLSVPSDTEVLKEIDKSSSKRPATDNVQEAAKILKPSIRIEFDGIQTTKEIEDDCNTGERACDGVALLINHATPFSPVQIRTSLQAVAVQFSIFSTVTICNVYLPPNAPLNFRELKELIDQLPSPFILLGDFNAHLLWGCQDVNFRGKVVGKLLAELDLTLLNDGSNTYFHSPTQSFSALDLSICSPSLLLDLTWSVLGNPLGSDHFPVVISYATPIACATLRQPLQKLDQADWETFRTQADITEDMVSSGSIDEAVSLVTSCILFAANNAISQPSSRLPRFPKRWWNEECQMAKKDQNKAWNQFRRYSTPDNDCF
ncbi:putative RNA-directed DNA polymerase from transposon X-element [Trichonephila inaurata madagascariensis]|uniref:Putative RNA-directed DNA polymerase from transposon X-element n=1 Tax=Trichonephila inaurata madagascariensis TaxID=2747483 RepID=A0A8X6YA15_9ARAC|nr:putative RNA-directed DNA polymerase from transposon X-element [Trichonephila inaurata madagascariensis]